MAASIRKAMTYLGLAEDAGPVEQTPEVLSDEALTPVTHIHRAQTSTPQYETPAEELQRIATVHPQAYKDVRIIGDAFRAGVPVIMNLTGMGEAEAKRLVDFCAGLTFGLHGKLEKVTNMVFLLSPEYVQVTSQEQAPAARGTSLFD